MGKEREFVVFVTTCCKPSLVEVEVVFAPSIVRWSLVVGYGPYPSSVEVDWLYCLGGIVG